MSIRFMTLIMVAGVAAFFGGRALQQRREGDSAKARSAAPPVVYDSAGRAVGTAQLRSRRNLKEIRLALDQAAAAKTPGEPMSFIEETPEAREQRHQEIDRKLTETLGDIPAEKRAKLIALNDDATEVKRRLIAALEAGDITHEEWDRETHEALLAQLDELRQIVDEDEYRALTGLEPGVDPYDYMRSGEGATEIPQHQPEVPTTDKKR